MQENAKLTEWNTYTLSHEGEAVILEGNVQTTPITGDSFAFYTVHQNITISCDGKLIYHFPTTENNPLANTSGYNWHFISLPNDLNFLHIVITSPYKGCEENIPVFYIGDTVSITARIIQENIISFLLAMIIFCLGICMIIYWIFIRIKTKIQPNLLLLGIFATILAVWSANESYFSTLLLQNNIITSYLSLVTLMMLPLPFSLFIRFHYADNHKIWDFFCIIDVVQIIICLFLQITGLADLRDTLWMTHVIFFILISILIFSSIRLLRNGIHSKQILTHLICITACIISLILDLLTFLLGIDTNNAFGRVGFLLYIIILGLFSIRESADLIKLGRQADLYHKLAFTDAMTQLHNRTAFNHDFSHFNTAPIDVAIIDFDLNNLKRTNDSLGHNIGDFYIISSAHIINHVFSKIGSCYRVGGDEFLVVVQQASNINFSKYFSTLEQEVKKFNHKHPEIRMEFAYGYAIYDPESDNSLEETYSRADKRMYEYKQKTKSES